jgi:hypothetical protein
MVKNRVREKLQVRSAALTIIGAAALMIILAGLETVSAKPRASDYQRWESIGRGAADESLKMLSKAGAAPGDWARPGVDPLVTLGLANPTDEAKPKSSGN